MNLRIPGPTPIPDSVLAASSKQMINHRGPEFKEILARVEQNLATVFQTKNRVLILTASGTGGLEAAVANILSPGERTLVISIGVFGDRVAKIAQAFGADVAKLSFPMGQAADPAAVRDALKKETAVKTVFVTHNETSTGVTNDLAALSKVIKGEFGKNLVVDGISSIGSLPCPVDEWNLDIAISGSQKGWMAPPGLALVAVSPKGWEAIAAAKMPRFYFDLAAAKASQEKGETPWTPALSVVYALDEGLRILMAEGVQQVFKRHARIGEYTRKGVRALGLELVADEKHASNTVTAAKLPAGVEWKALSSTLRNEYKVVLGGGQGTLTGKILRVGHLGFVNEKDIEDALNALGKSLKKVRATGTPAGGA